MDHRLERGRQVVGAIVTEVRSENVTFLAGSIAYHAFVSLLPFLILVLVAVSRVGDEALAEDLLVAMTGYLTPEFRRVLVSAATNATRSAGLSFVGVAVLLWGTLRIFRGLDQAFSEIYESASANTFVDQLLDGVVVFGTVAVAVLAISLSDDVIAVPAVGPAASVLRPLLSVVVVTVVLLPMFYVFPDAPVTVREAVPGAVVAAAGWTALSLVFGIYAESASATEYGIVGVVILLVTWLYFGGLALLVGAAVNAVLAGRSEDVPDIAWGREVDGTAAHNDATFVEPLRALETADWETPVRVRVDGIDVTLPPPAEVTVDVSTVERPTLLGGDRESGRVVLRWDSR